MNNQFMLDDEQYHNFLKSKKRKNCEADYVKQGKTQVQAKYLCKQDLGGGVLAKGVKKVSLAIPRGSALSLIRLNFRGFASRVLRARNENPDEYKDVLRKWNKLGGDEKAFLNSVKAGAGKKPLFCGEKCKDKIGKISNFAGDSEDEKLMMNEMPDIAYDNVAGVDDAVLVGLIATGGTLIGTLVSSLAKTRQTKLEKEAELESAKLQAQVEKANAPEVEKTTRRNNTIIAGILISTLVLIGVVALYKRSKNK